MAKTTHSLSAERRDRLKPALSEEVRSLCDLEPASSEYLFGKNMNESLKLAQKNYKLSQNLVSTKSRKKAAGPSSRTGFKRRPDHETGNSFCSTVFKLPRPKKDIFIENTTVSEEHQIQEILTACNKNVSRFDYFWPKSFRNKIKAFKVKFKNGKILHQTKKS